MADVAIINDIVNQRIIKVGAGEDYVGTGEGTYYGVGFTIAWQQGEIAKGQNGALPIEVLRVIRSHLQNVDQSGLTSARVKAAIGFLGSAITELTAWETKPPKTLPK